MSRSKRSPNSSAPTPAEDYIVLGTIVRPHGLKGEVKVSLSCSGLDRLASCKNLWLVKGGRELKKATVVRAFLYNDGDAVIRLKEVKGAEEAEALRGAYLAVLPGDKACLPSGTYYLDDLLGLSVVTLAGEDLGRI